MIAILSAAGTVAKLLFASKGGLLVAGALALAGFGAIKVMEWRAYNEGDRAGYARAFDDIAAQNKRAGESADRAVDRIRACITGGGMWSQSSGKCQR